MANRYLTLFKIVEVNTLIENAIEGLDGPVVIVIYQAAFSDWRRGRVWGLHQMGLLARAAPTRYFELRQELIWHDPEIP